MDREKVKVLDAETLIVDNETPEEKAWSKGYADCWDGVKIDYPPYNNEALQKEWIKGWNHYDAEYNPKYVSHSYASKMGWR